MCCIEQTLSHADTSESASGRMVNCSHAAIPKKNAFCLPPACLLPPYLTQVRLFFSFPSGARMGSAPIINPSLYLPTYLTYQVRGYSLCAGGTNTAFSAKHVGYQWSKKVVASGSRSPLVGLVGKLGPAGRSSRGSSERGSCFCCFA